MLFFFIFGATKNGRIKSDRNFLEEQRSKGQADDTHQVDQDVQGRTRSIFERVAYSIAVDCGSMSLRAFTAEIAVLDVFLSIVPSTAGISHEDS